MTWPARRTAILLLLAVFLVGVAAGWVLEEVVDELDWPGQSSGAGRGDAPRGVGDFDEDEEEEFLESLGLTKAQLDAVDRLLDEGEDRIEEYWKGRLPEIEALLASTRDGIRRLLTSEQRAAYDRWLAGQRHPTTEP